jgi:hypothetical protein
MAAVFAFKGRVYYAKPGWEYRPLEVQEDFRPWRPAMSQDGKQIAVWLVKHGFRLAYRKIGQGAMTCDYEEWWATLALIGAQGDCPPRELRSRLAGELQESA